jgi:multicomponent Na+:H+ antiporter subunit E
MNPVVRAWRILRLILAFLREFALSVVRVSQLVLSPRIRVRPAVIAFPLTVRRDFEITLLANLITLTPGTLTIDVSDNRSILYVHVVDCPDPAIASREIADGFERLILEAFA